MPVEREDVQVEVQENASPARRGLPLGVKALILLLLLAVSSLATTVAGLAWPDKVVGVPLLGSLFPPVAPEEKPASELIQENERVLEEARLEVRRLELKEARADLEALVAEIEVQKKDLEDRKAEVSETLAKVDAARAAVDEEQAARLKKLAKVCGAMEPGEAAAVLSQLDIKTSTAVFGYLKEKEAAGILAAMSQEEALAIASSVAGNGGSSGVSR